VQFRLAGRRHRTRARAHPASTASCRARRLGLGRTQSGITPIALMTVPSPSSGSATIPSKRCSRAREWNRRGRDERRRFVDLRRRRTSRPLPDEPTSVGAFGETADGKLWAGGMNGAVWRYTGDGVEVVNPISRAAIVTLIECAARSGPRASAPAWCGSTPRHDRRLRVTPRQRPPRDTLWGLFEDREHNLCSPRTEGASASPRLPGFQAYTGQPHAGEPPALSRPERLHRPSNRRRHLVGTGGGLAALGNDGTRAC